MADTINRAKSVDPAAIAKAAAENQHEPLISSSSTTRAVRFDKSNQNEMATGVVTQIGWDGEKHTIWPWELAKRANFKIIFPSPSWPERDSKPKPAS
jgi:hypothetical protein